MIDVFASLPLPVTTAIVTVASVLVLLLVSLVVRNRWRWVAAAVVPIAVAYGTYWAPVWFGGASPSEHSAWEGMFLFAWGGSGIVACMIVTALRRAKVR